MTDAERLDWLEKMAHMGEGLLLHAKLGPTGKVGLGLSHRTLRKAIDQAAGSESNPSCDPK